MLPCMQLYGSKINKPKIHKSVCVGVMQMPRIILRKNKVAEIDLKHGYLTQTIKTQKRYYTLFIITYICRKCIRTYMGKINNKYQRVGNRISQQFTEGFNHM